MALNKKPNAAHLAIAECEARLRKQGRSVVVITQCIDDLHHQAGSKHVLRVHGETQTGRLFNPTQIWSNRSKNLIRFDETGHLLEHCEIPVVYFFVINKCLAVFCLFLTSYLRFYLSEMCNADML